MEPGRSSLTSATLDNCIALPGTQAYAAATRVFNLTETPEPAAAITAHTVDDIRAAIRFADAEGLALRVHTTGHHSATARPMPESMLIRTLMDGEVTIDPVRRTARVSAGTQWGSVVEAAAACGLACPHGSSPTVGVVGYLLRGGVSFYGRKTGLAVNSVRSIELVTADGELRLVSADSDPELFWALRGGGGGFGVVTAVEIGLFPLTQVITGAAFWPVAHAERILTAWRRWAATAPWEAATSLRVMNLPNEPDVPPVLSAGPVVCVAGVVMHPASDGTVDAGSTADAAGMANDLLGPLRSIAEPVMDTWEPAPVEGVLESHMDPTDPLAMLGDHMLVRELGDDGSAEFLRIITEGGQSPLVVAELRQLGGAIAVPDPSGGALRCLDAPYAYMVVGLPDGPESAAAITSECGRARRALAPWDTGRTTPTFVENFTQPQGHLSAEQIAEVDRIRARVDPQGRFADDIMTNATATR